ncbi:MAG: M1 family peptidase, partial [Bacteroidetes bacterium]|nr:M1 family peptidase [Bacteroidota bacterium]
MQHYDVHLRIDRDDPTLRGRATLTVHLDDTVDALRLGFSGLRLDSLRVDGVAVDGRRRGSILSIPGPWPPKPYRVDIQYTGEPSTGYYRKEVGDDTVRFTDSWPTRGRGWLPGVHHPSDPATLRLTLDAPIGPDVVATGALIRRDTLQTGHVRTSWSLDVPAPTYAFGFAVADFDAAADTTVMGLPLGVYSLPGAASMAPALPTVARAAEALTELLGPYPYANYRAAHVPIAYAGMENVSLAFIDPTLSGAAQATVLVHELAHQWFGNHVVLDDWHDLWLSEGMATFLAIYAMERQDALAARARWIELARLSPQRRRSMVPLVRPTEAEPDAHLTWVVYEKGASVLYLLRQTVGEA